MISMAQDYEKGACITVVSLSEKLGISKIYLEQVFALLKKAELVNAVKGAQGGYRLIRPPKQISALEILSSLEFSLFEKTVSSVSGKAENIEIAMRDCVFSVLDASVEKTLGSVSLGDLAAEAEKIGHGEGYMFYI